MRQHFFGYYEMTPEQFKKLWKECVFVVDTNVLLDMYRLSADASEALFQTLDLVKDRLWVPYHVAQEYHKEIITVLLSQIKNCKDMISTSNQMITKIFEKCRVTRNFPYLSEGLQERLRKIAEDIENEVGSEQSQLEELINNNPTQDKIAELLDGRLWERLTDKQLNEIYAEGKKRYEQKIPPGFGDMKNKQGNDVYGDLVIWEEMIAYAEKHGKDVIFISSDTSKEDWFIKVGRSARGPRAELRMEFSKRTKGRTYYAYPTATFLAYAEEYIQAPKVSEAIIEEVASMITEKHDTESSSDGSALKAGCGSTANSYDQIEESSESES